MRRSFDQTKLKPEDYDALFEAVKRAAYKDLQYGFYIPNVWRVEGCIDAIVKQLGAIGQVEIGKEPARGIRGWVGYEDIVVGVGNPTAIHPSIRVGGREIFLRQMIGYGPGNQYDAVVDFEHGEASLREEDQDIAHRLGLVYTPKGMIDMFSLTASSPETHREKQQRDENGQPILYCDNLTCKRPIRNPILVIDERTGGTYHSKICEIRDAQAKADEGVKVFSPIYVPIEVARKLYEQGRLQQAPKFQATL